MVAEAEATEADKKDAFIEFDKVTFSYNKEEPNLSDISFVLAKGETLGIIGETGAGNGESGVAAGAELGHKAPGPQ